MDERAWQRHSNPLSVYSRFTTLPLISLAFWSREFLEFYALIPIIIAVVWVWLNPRIFGVPVSTNNWASMGTFGERIYLNRKSESIPSHHMRACRVLLALQVLGLPIWLYGLYSLNLWSLVLGTVWLMISKAWFVDRMVWLYLDVKDQNPIYQSWLRS
ncbi:MAG: DUF6653 family protein [Motiliproteus sp.]